jgi:hypothetical protein
MEQDDPDDLMIGSEAAKDFALLKRRARAEGFWIPEAALVS